MVASSKTSVNATAAEKPLPAVRQLQVGAEYQGQRLDNFLFRELKGVPKTHIHRIIRSGEVRINKHRARSHTRVEGGDVLRIPPVRMSDATEVAPAPALNFPILLEDDCLLIVDKPEGVAVHGGSGVQFGVIEQLRSARPDLPFLELVHRLDKETSGLLVLAKRNSALRQMQAQFRERVVQKTYLSMVKGHWPQSNKVIDMALHKYLRPDGERRVSVVANNHPDAMRAISLVQVLQSGRLKADPSVLASLLQVRIKTGRTHQIRVHLAHAGFPILGDEKYGDFACNKSLRKKGLDRMFLHAFQLQFEHPKTKEIMQVSAPLPSKLNAFELQLG